MTLSLGARVRNLLSGRGTTTSRYRRRTAVLLAATLTAVPLAACGSSDDSVSADGVVTLKVAMWDPAEQPELVQPLIAKFEQTHPKIKIELQPIPFSDFEQKMLQQIQAGETPDVIQTYGDYTADFAAAGALAPLDDVASKQYQAQTSKEALDAGVIDGKLVAVPWAVEPVGLWYNKKIMAQAGLDPNKPPATIDELMKDLAAVKAKAPDVIPMGIDSTNRVFGLDVNWPWLKAFGAVPVDGDTATANTPGMSKYLDFMRTLAQDNYTEINQKIGYFRPLAAQNKVAFIEDQSILESTIKVTDPSITDKVFNDTWGVATMPTGADGTSYSVPQDHQLAMMQASKHQQEAWEFIDWMTRSEDADLHVIKYKSAFPSAAKLPASAQALVNADPSLEFFRDKIAPTTVNPPWGPKYAAVADPVMVGVQQAMTSTDSVDAIASEMQDSITSALQQ